MANSEWLWARQILDALPEYIFWKDQHSNYRGCNRHFARLVGLTDPADIIGKRDDNLPWQVHANFFRQGDRQALAGQPVLNQEESLTLKGREPITVSVNKHPIYDASGQICGLVGIARDITLSKQLLSDLNRPSMSQPSATLAQHIAHSLRTPCSGMMGLTEELTQILNSTPQQTCVNQLRQSCLILLNSLNQMINFISSDQQPKRYYFAPKRLFNQQIDRYRAAAELKGLAFSSNGLEQLPDQWLGDAARLEEMLSSLLSNAVTYTERGSIDLSLSVSQQPLYDQLTVRITDTGIGIALEDQQRIFQPFVRLQPHCQGQGMGLGLTLTQRSIELLGGHITVTSTPGQGSCFSCHLPFQSVPTPTPRVVIHSDGPMKVLMVEDNAIVHLAQSIQLKRLNCQVDIAVDAQSALAKIQQQSYDWVLLDLGLPDQSGLVVAQQIRQRYNAQTLPIIVLSAHLDDSLTQACQAAGIQASFVKPLTTEQAQRLIHDLQQGVLYDHSYSTTD